jgi:hypothetical protein
VSRNAPVPPALAVLALFALFALAACAHGDGYRGGTYAAFTFAPAPTAAPRLKPTPQILARWIAADRAQLRTLRRGSAPFTAYEADLMNALYLSHRDAELERELALVRRTVPGAAEPPRDRAFVAGDLRAGFDAYATGAAMREPLLLARAARWSEAIARLRGVHERAFVGSSIAAALLEGDVDAACGRYDAARTTWHRAFSTGVPTAAGRGRFFPEWTSAMNRLVHERNAKVRPSSQPTCRDLPRPLPDPTS